jgi:hypothetical protein
VRAPQAGRAEHHSWPRPPAREARRQPRQGAPPCAATLRKDGSPRVSGSEVTFQGPDLSFGSMPNAVKPSTSSETAAAPFTPTRVKTATRRLPGSPSRSRARPGTPMSPAANHPAPPTPSGLSSVKQSSPQSKATNSLSGSGALDSEYGLSAAGNPVLLGRLPGPAASGCRLGWVYPVSGIQGLPSAARVRASSQPSRAATRRAPSSLRSSATACDS